MQRSVKYEFNPSPSKTCIEPPCLPSVLIYLCPSFLPSAQPPHLLFLIQLPPRMVNLMHIQKARALPCICSS